MYYKTNVITMTKVIVTDPENSQSLVDYLSAYRTYGHVAGSKKRLKYFPQGALFWFECDKYGRRTGPAIYIKHVPDKTVGMHVPDSGMNRIAQKTYEPSSIQQSVCFDRKLVPLSKAKKYIFREERTTINE